MGDHNDIDHSGLTGVPSANPQFTTIELGHASDTTLARSSAGNVTIEGNAIYRAGGTDVAVADGGTGASTAAAARTALSAQETLSGLSLSDVGTPASGDLVLLQDVSDSSNLKVAQFSAFGGGGSLSSFEEVLAADVTMTNANQYYDVLTHSCPSGTWLFIARTQFISSGSNSHVYTSKLYESGGPTVWDEAEASGFGSTNNGWYYQSTSLAIVTLGATTTVRLATADVRASNVVKREIDTNSATSHTATKLIGVKIA